MPRLIIIILPGRSNVPRGEAQRDETSLGGEGGSLVESVDGR